MKVLLLGVLLASPPVAAWILHEPKPAPQIAGIQLVANTALPHAANGAVQVPVEVVTTGSAPQWVYVEVQSQSIPEPGVVSLLALTSLLLLRRQRAMK